MASIFGGANMADPPAQTSPYMRLPSELKLQIAQLAFAELPYIDEGRRSTSRFAWPNYACIDSAWRETVERALWETLYLKVADLPKFQSFWVGRRRHFLATIVFRVDITNCWSPMLGENNQGNAAILANSSLELVMAGSLVWTAFSELFSVLEGCEAEQDKKDIRFEVRYDIYNSYQNVNSRGRYEMDIRDPYLRRMLELPIVKVIKGLTMHKDQAVFFLCPASIVMLASSLPELTNIDFDFEPDQLSLQLASKLCCKDFLYPACRQYFETNSMV